MMQITYTSAAIRQLKKLSTDVQARIVAKLVRYAETGEGDVKALQGVDAMRLRVGDWRIVFTRDGVVLTVFKIAHRREVY